MRPLVIDELMIDMALTGNCFYTVKDSRDEFSIKRYPDFSSWFALSKEYDYA